jgi:hypothetical protein
MVYWWRAIRAHCILRAIGLRASIAVSLDL